METSKRTIFFPYLTYLFSNLIFSLISFWMVFVLVIRLKDKFNIIIHVHDPTIGTFLFFLSSKLIPSVALVSHFHSEYTERLKIMLTKCWLDKFTVHLYSISERICILKSDAVVVVSNAICRYLVRLGCESKKIIKLPIFLDTSYLQKNVIRRKELRKKFGIGKSDFIIIYVGRLSREKNLETLISAFSSINGLLIENMCLLIAGGEQSPSYTSFDNAKVNKIVFLGHRNDVSDLLHLSDVFVLPSFTEGFPFGLLEAMACGKAIIASDIPAIREIVVNGKEALLFDPYSPEQLKEAILKLYYNPELRRELGENAEKKAKQYDIGAVFPKIVEVYQEVLRNKNKK